MENLNQFIEQYADEIMYSCLSFLVSVLVFSLVFWAIDYDQKPKYTLVCINGIEYIEDKSLFKSVVPSYNHDGTIKECRDTIGS